MTTERFNEVVKEQLDRIEKLLVKKQAEYNRENGTHLSYGQFELMKWLNKQKKKRK